MNSFFEIPGLCHIGRKIIFSLNFKNQAICRHVCRSWNTFIEDLSSKMSKEHLIILLEKISEKRSLSFYKKVNWKCFILLSCATFEYLTIFNLYVKHALIENDFAWDRNGRIWNSPLQIFVSLGNIKMVKLILENSLDIIHSYDWTILHEAVEQGHTDTVKFLLENHYIYMSSIQKLKENSLHRNPLHIASQNGNLEMVKILMPNPNNCKLVSDRHGFTPIHIAVTEGYMDIVEYFINNVTQFNRRDTKGNSPLHKALKIGNFDMVKLITENVNEKCIRLLDDYGRNVIHTAAKNGYVEVLKIFCQKAKRPILKARDRDGNTPLHLAAKFGHFECVKVLIDFKISFSIIEMLKIRNNAKLKAIDLARENDHFQIVEYLMKS